MSHLPGMLLTALALAMATGPAQSQEIASRDWQLLALDGMRVEPGTTLRLEADGMITGQAPCNGYGTRNGATLPVLALQPVRATRMACPRLEEEQAFFDALGVMTEAALSGPDRLILTGPDGRSMEFVIMADLTTCETCPHAD